MEVTVGCAIEDPMTRHLLLLAPVLASTFLLSGCPTGWFAPSGGDSRNGDLTASFLPNPPVIGQPITVMGYVSIPPDQLSTSTVRIQLTPTTTDYQHRIEIGTASLVAGHFSWTETLLPAYGGVAVTASQSYVLFAMLPDIRSKTGQATMSQDVGMYFTPIATAGP